MTIFHFGLMRCRLLHKGSNLDAFEDMLKTTTAEDLMICDAYAPLSLLSKGEKKYD